MRTTFGQTVRKLRLIYDMTQKEASVKSGICHTKLSDLENGKRVPTAEDIERLSKLFGVKPKTMLILSKRLETVDRKSDRFLKVMSEALIKFFADCKEVKEE